LSEGCSIEEARMEQKAPSNLVRLITQPKFGSEPFHSKGEALGPTLLDFWRWSVSDLVSNATRGRLAEFIVANALGISVRGVRNEWSPFDLQTEEGVKVEVKSAAYIQSWFQSKLSAISFRTPKTRAFDPETNRLESEAKRQADVYVFAVLKHQDKSTIDPLNLDQWEFYVVPTAILNARTRSQFGITLTTLRGFCTPIGYTGLRAEVLRAASSSAGNNESSGEVSCSSKGN